MRCTYCTISLSNLNPTHISPRKKRRQLGGMFILDENLQEITFEFREKFAGDSPTIVDVLKSVGVVDDVQLERLDPKRRILQLAQEAAAAKIVTAVG